MLQNVIRLLNDTSISVNRNEGTFRFGGVKQEPLRCVVLKIKAWKIASKYQKLRSQDQPTAGTQNVLFKPCFPPFLHSKCVTKTGGCM